MRRRLVTDDEAQQSNGRQHTRPCADCPWARASLRGWLGDGSVDEWIATVHGDSRIECHTSKGAQCAGSSIYRANVCKVSKDPDVLTLPADREKVFTFGEFEKHHTRVAHD